MTFYVHKYGVHNCTIDKVPNSGLKNPKKCNIWHLPAKFGSTVLWDYMCLHEFIGGPAAPPAALAASAASAVQVVKNSF